MQFTWALSVCISFYYSNVCFVRQTSNTEQHTKQISLHLRMPYIQEATMSRSWKLFHSKEEKEEEVEKSWNLRRTSMCIQRIEKSNKQCTNVVGFETTRVFGFFRFQLQKKKKQYERMKVIFINVNCDLIDFNVCINVCIRKAYKRVLCCH